MQRSLASGWIYVNNDSKKRTQIDVRFGLSRFVNKFNQNKRGFLRRIPWHDLLMAAVSLKFKKVLFSAQNDTTGGTVDATVARIRRLHFKYLPFC
jgi:hypothetical protein